MGCCLFGLIELIFDAIIEGYLALMSLFLPEEKLSKASGCLLDIAVKAFAMILLIIMGVGVVFGFLDDPELRNIGRYMIFVPLAIIAVQIVFGIVMRIVTRRKK